MSPRTLDELSCGEGGIERHLTAMVKYLGRILDRFIEANKNYQKIEFDVQAMAYQQTISQ